MSSRTSETADVEMRPPTRKLRPVFIGGCPRSGTTLLGALIGAHSRCVCVPEMPFKVHPLHLAADESTGIAPTAMRRMLQHHPFFRHWGIEATADAPDPERRMAYRDAIEDLVRRYAAAVDLPNAEVWADHTPSNILHSHTLLERFPDAVLLHIVRDGRAVAASLLPLPWSVGTIFAASAVWAEHLAHGLAAEAANPGRVHRIRYEELVREPKRVMRRICEIIALDWEPQLGSATRFRVPPAASYQHPLVMRPPDLSRADAWRNSLSRREIEIFESLSGSLLAHLGYDLEFGGRAKPATRREKVREALGESFGQLQRLGWRVITDAGARLRPGVREPRS